MSDTLEGLAARVAALEADRADYRAVLTAVGALSSSVAGQHEAIGTLAGRVETLAGRVETLTVRSDAYQQSINALGLKLAEHQSETRTKFDEVSAKIDSHRNDAAARFNSVDEHLAEVKSLLVEALGR